VAFLGVGVLSAAIDAGGFSILYALGVRAALASAISFCCSVVVNYSGNRAVVFRVRHRSSVLLRYLGLVGINLVLATAVVAGLVAAGLEAHIAKLASMALIAGLNYVVMGAWVFRETDPTPPVGAPVDDTSA
jgi:putative flippase GtrA